MPHVQGSVWVKKYGFLAESPPLDEPEHFPKYAAVLANAAFRSYPDHFLEANPRAPLATLCSVDDEWI